MSNNPAAESWIKRTIHALGPGVTTGAADDDPSGVANCQVSCDTIQQRIWRLSAARDALTQLYQHLGA